MIEKENEDLKYNYDYKSNVNKECIIDINKEEIIKTSFNDANNISD